MVKMCIKYYKDYNDNLRIMSQNWLVYRGNCNSPNLRYKDKMKSFNKSKKPTLMPKTI